MIPSAVGLLWCVNMMLFLQVIQIGYSSGGPDLVMQADTFHGPHILACRRESMLGLAINEI